MRETRYEGRSRKSALVGVLRSVLLTEYYSGDQTKNNEIGGTCSTRELRAAYRVLTGKPERERPLAKPRRRREDIIKK
jgi:hypothetical protein